MDKTESIREALKSLVPGPFVIFYNEETKIGYSEALIVEWLSYLLTELDEADEQIQMWQKIAKNYFDQLDTQQASWNAQYDKTLVELSSVKQENERLSKFYNYFSDFYGTGLMVANWHMNGDMEPFDNFLESAKEGGVVE